MRFLCFALCCLLAGCHTVNQWVDSYTGTSTPLPAVKGDQRVTTLWMQTIGKGSGSFNLIPAVDEQRIFAIDSEGQLYAINSNTGQLLWQHKTGQRITAGVTASHGMILVSNINNQLLAYAQDTGRLLWQAILPNQLLVAPLISDDQVIVKTIDGKLASYQLENGKLRWNYEHGAPALVLHTPSMPIRVYGEILVGYSDGKLAAYTKDTGQLRWERSIAFPGGNNVVEQIIDVTPHLYLGTVYASSYSGQLAAIDPVSGRLKWQRALSSIVGLTAGDKGLFVTDLNGTITRLDNTTGKTLNEQTTLNMQGMMQPALGNNVVVVGDQKGYIHLIDAKDLHLRARSLIHEGDVIANPPLILGNKIFVLTQQGLLAALRVD